MSKSKVQPLGENVLIQPVKADKKTTTGIFLPESASAEKPQEGRVIAVGEHKEIKVKKGQRVIFRRYSGTEVKIDDEEYLIVKNEDVLAVIQ
ncbi:co-chaperone GroES [Patescibacteria group bacterium]|nr:MAG: co-chaperone GroES [Patescibacteria group bacterium]